MRLFLFFHAAMLLAGSTVLAQAGSTADQGVRLQAYALGSYVRPDYGGALKNAGGTLGGNILVGRFFGRLDPSLDLRVMGSGGRVSNQYFLGLGPRLVVDFNRIKPFGEFLIGGGSIHFQNPPDPNYTRDNSLVYGAAAGADIPLGRSFALRAEGTYQRWQLSHLTPPFHPVSVGVGLRYEFHFKGRGGPDL